MSSTRAWAGVGLWEGTHIHAARAHTHIDAQAHRHKHTHAHTASQPGRQALKQAVTEEGR